MRDDEIRLVTPVASAHSNPAHTLRRLGARSEDEVICESMRRCARFLAGTDVFCDCSTPNLILVRSRAVQGTPRFETADEALGAFLKMATNFSDTWLVEAHAFAAVLVVTFGRGFRNLPVSPDPLVARTLMSEVAVGVVHTLSVAVVQSASPDVVAWAMWVPRRVEVLRRSMDVR